MLASTDLNPIDRFCAFDAAVPTLRLGADGLRVSAIGLGCMGMSDFYARAGLSSCISTLKAAMQLGVTFWDTADIYGSGANELLLSTMLATHRHEIVLATKFGIVRDDAGTFIGVNGRPEYAVASCEKSLQRLGIETIDLFYLHKPDPKVPIEDTVGAMARLVEQGKIRHLGLSQASLQDIGRAHKVHPISAVQGELSLWSATYDTSARAAIHSLNIGFVAHSPLGRGFLTGAFQHPTDLETGDRRRLNPRFKGEHFYRNKALMERVDGIAKSKACTTAQLAMAWLFQQDNRAIPIPGTTREAHLRQNTEATAIRLTFDELSECNRLHGDFLRLNNPELNRGDS